MRARVEAIGRRTGRVDCHQSPANRPSARGRRGWL